MRVTRAPVKASLTSKSVDRTLTGFKVARKSLTAFSKSSMFWFAVELSRFLVIRIIFSLRIARVMPRQVFQYR